MNLGFMNIIFSFIKTLGSILAWQGRRHKHEGGLSSVRLICCSLDMLTLQCAQTWESWLHNLWQCGTVFTLSPGCFFFFSFFCFNDRDSLNNIFQGSSGLCLSNTEDNFLCIIHLTWVLNGGECDTGHGEIKIFLKILIHINFMFET